MKEVIKKMDSSLLSVNSVMEYLERIQDYEVVVEDIRSADNASITLQTGEEFIKLIFLDIQYAKWWSVYRKYSDGTTYEQIDIFLYHEIRDNSYNRIIKYSAHMEDEEFSYITGSCFSYLDDKIVYSEVENRVVPIQDLDKIQYRKDMNLTELIGMADEKSSHILKKESLKNVKTLSLSIEK